MSSHFLIEISMIHPVFFLGGQITLPKRGRFTYLWIPRQPKLAAAIKPIPKLLLMLLTHPALFGSSSSASFFSIARGKWRIIVLLSLFWGLSWPSWPPSSSDWNCSPSKKKKMIWDCSLSKNWRYTMALIQIYPYF